MSRYRQNPDIAWRVIDGDVVLFDTVAGMMRQLNAVGCAVWEALAEPRSVEELAVLVAGRFEVTVERARADVEAFLPKLVERKLVEAIVESLDD